MRKGKGETKQFSRMVRNLWIFLVVGNVIQNFNLLYVALMHGDEYLHLRTFPPGQ